jgi:uncharacterized protein (DUF302 family)
LTIQTTAYAHRVELDLPFDRALESVTRELKAQGFGVLTEIDIQAKLKEKLGAEFRRYTILGACNPPLAYKALQSEIEIGVLLPCNVVVYEKPDGGSVVSAMAPLTAMSMVSGNDELEDVAKEADDKLRATLAKLQSES